MTSLHGRAGIAALVAFVALAAAACVRHDYVHPSTRPELCPVDSTPPRPAATQQFLLEPLPTGLEASVGRLVGQVIDSAEARPVSRAAVLIQGAGPGGAYLEVFTDSLGRFRFPTAPPGRWPVIVRRLGYLSHQDTVDIPLPAGTQLRIWLPAQATVLDGFCGGYVHVAVPRPWWRWWLW